MARGLELIVSRIPPVAKVSGLNRLPLNTETLPPRSTARLMGAAHQACRRLNPSVTATAAAPVSASLTTNPVCAG